jgi:hypothetical protein
MNKAFLFLLGLALVVRGFGQEGAVLLLKGRIVNASGEPVPYANIGMARSGIGTMSNEEGLFIFKIPVEEKKDSIYISHIGYQPVVIFSSEKDTGIQTIILKERSVELPGVTVTQVNALQLIRKAMDRIPENYPSRPYVSYGFYRFASWSGGKIAQLSEAVFDIDCPDNDRKDKIFRLIKVRADRDPPAILKGKNWSAGRHPGDLMDDDIVSRIHRTEFLGDDAMNNHVFIFNGVIDDQDKPAYEILFDQKDSLFQAGYTGKILIDSESLAFLSFEYSLSPKGKAYWQSINPNGPASEGISMVVTYRKYGGKYYLNHVRRRAIWRHDQLNGLVMDNRSIYLVTRIDTGQIRRNLPGKEIANNEAIERNANKNSSRGDDFWENYNLIEADFNVDSTLRAIRQGH